MPATNIGAFRPAAGVKFPSPIHRPGDRSIDSSLRRLHASLSLLAGPPPAAPRVASAELVESLSARLDPGHAVVLRALLEGERSLDGGLPEGEHPALEPFLARLSVLADEMNARFASLENGLPERFGFATLGEHLRRQNWLVQGADGVWTVPGKGTFREGRALFYLAFHDLLADGERILVQTLSRLAHLQDNVAERWASESSQGGELAKIVPCIEEGLRASEGDRWRDLRLRLGVVAEQSFCAAVTHWDRLRFGEPEALYAAIPRRWTGREHDGNGFHGFAHALLGAARGLGQAAVGHHAEKWKLYLRGFTPRHAEASAQ